MKAHEATETLAVLQALAGRCTLCYGFGRVRVPIIVRPQASMAYSDGDILPVASRNDVRMEWGECSKCGGTGIES